MNGSGPDAIKIVMSQEELGKALGVSFQQIQKYESYIAEIFGAVGKGIREFRKESGIGPDGKPTTIVEKPVETVTDKS